MVEEEFKLEKETYYSDVYNAIEQDPARVFNSKPLCQILELANWELTNQNVNEADIKNLIKNLLKKFYPFYNLIGIMENNGDMDVIIKDPDRIAHDRTLLCFCAELGMFTKSKNELENVLAEYFLTKTKTIIQGMIHLQQALIDLDLPH
jgi:hypothetical protein